MTLCVWRIGDGSAEREMGGQAGTTEVQSHRADWGRMAGWFCTLAGSLGGGGGERGEFFSLGFFFLSCLLFLFWMNAMGVGANICSGSGGNAGGTLRYVGSSEVTEWWNRL